MKEDFPEGDPLEEGSRGWPLPTRDRGALPGRLPHFPQTRPEAPIFKSSSLGMTISVDPSAKDQPS